MESLRIARVESLSTLPPCCRCAKGDRPWDRIADKAYCPNCQEALVMGEAPPLIERTQPSRCAVCAQAGTVAFQTLPLHGSDPIDMDLCPAHLRALLGRMLEPQAYHHLCRRLTTLQLGPEDIFLLHGAFYDAQGRALQPAVEPI